MTKYDKQPQTLRRFRLFDGRTSRPIPHRYYRWHKNAHEGTAAVMVWAKVGETIEIVDISKGRLLAQYTRERTGIRIHREKEDRQ